MSCFRLPKGILSKISSLCASFWWGSSGTKNRIHWRKWSDLCQPKELGGLNFRDLETFNQAMLAKQGWRVLVNPESTVARVLRGKYFPHSDLFEATSHSNSSFFWKSFIWGLELLKGGCRKQIRNGLSVRVLEDPWIPRPWTFKIFGCKDQCEDLKVADCI